MKDMFQIAHISDPHLSRQHYREHIKSFKMLLRSMLTGGADHIIISGDIVSTAHEDDYYLAREILSNHQLLDSSRLTIVPGNHDIFGGPHRAIDVFSFPQHIRSVDYARHTELFKSAFAETFQGVTRLSETSLFPFVKTAGPFNIIGLNSIPPWSFRQNPLGTNGMLDDQQIDALEKIASFGILADRTNIIVIHHHFNDIVQSEYRDRKTVDKNRIKYHADEEEEKNYPSLPIVQCTVCLAWSYSPKRDIRPPWNSFCQRGRCSLR